MPSSRDSSDPLLGSSSADGDGQLTPTEDSCSQSLWDEDWMSDTGSTQVEKHPLLKGYSPSSSYQEPDPAALRNQSAGRSTPLQGTQKAFDPSADPPCQLIDIDAEPQHYRRSFNVHRAHGPFGGKCPLFAKAFLKIVLMVALFSASFLIFQNVFSSLFRPCPTTDLVTRDYQVETLKTFEFSNSHTQNSGLPKGFRGTMRILSGPADQTVDLNVSIKSTDSDIHGGKLGAKWRPSSLSPCAEASLYFRRGLELSDFQIAGQKLSLMLSLDRVVIETTSISLHQGKLVSEAFGSSRETKINMKKGPVRGAFGLGDLLSIRSRSGSVSVDINPRPAVEGRSAVPAVLEVESRSGSVHVNYPANESSIPDRDYRTTINSRSGSVRAKTLHGSETNIEIRSGRLDAQILPFGIEGVSSSLKTEQRSGHTSVEILRPRGHGDPLSRMSSSHSARSGQLDLRYPDEWEGTIYGDAKSGSISLQGQGVEIIKQKDKSGHNYVHAKKGHGESELKFEIRSGGASATFG